MSFQRITIIGSMPLANSDATAARTIRSASFSSRWISTRCAASVVAVAQPAQRGDDLLGRAHEHVGHLLGLLHRRLDAVEPELVGGLLGEVDDVVERARQRVDVGGVEVRAPRRLLGEAAEDLVGDPVALVLALDDRLGRAPAGSGIVGEQVAQQLARRAARCARTPRTARGARWVLLAPPHMLARVPARARMRGGRSQPLHDRVHAAVTAARRGRAIVRSRCT